MLKTAYVLRISYWVSDVCSSDLGIMHRLAHKQALADGVLDGEGDLSALKMPSGRAAMIERMQAMMEAAERPRMRVLSPEEALVEELRSRHGERLVLAEMRGPRLLAVLDGSTTALAAERERLTARDGATALPVEVVDPEAWQTM